jgi:hypothetical protein
MPDGIEVTHDPEIPVHLVQLHLCKLCIDGVGGECHTPGCSLWINRAPDISLRDNPGVTIMKIAAETEDAVTPGQAAYRVGDRVSVTGMIVGVNDSDSDWVNVEAFGAVFTVEPSGHPDLSPVAARQPRPDPADALHALAAKWDANAARNQRNGQSLIDQGDEYGNEGLAVAEALGACVVELRALLSDMEPTRPEPATEAAPAAETAPAT